MYEVKQQWLELRSCHRGRPSPWDSGHAKPAAANAMGRTASVNDDDTGKHECHPRSPQDLGQGRVEQDTGRSTANNFLAWAKKVNNRIIQAFIRNKAKAVGAHQDSDEAPRQAVTTQGAGPQGRATEKNIRPGDGADSADKVNEKQIKENGEQCGTQFKED